MLINILASCLCLSVASAISIRSVRGTTALAQLQSNVADTRIFNSLETVWEDCLIFTPGVVNLFGQLIILSSKVDFSLARRNYVPIGGWQYVRNPTSFRSTLIQVTNDAWLALEVVQGNMHKIQLYMGTVPASIVGILELIDDRDTDMIKYMMPFELEQIKKAGTQSAKVALESHDALLDVVKLLGEVLTAAGKSQTSYELDLYNVTNQIQQAESFKTSMQDVLNNQNKYVATLTASVERYQNEFKVALDEIPVRWEKIWMDVVVSVGQGISNLAGIGGNSDANDEKSGSGSQGNAGVDKQGGVGDPDSAVKCVILKESTDSFDELTKTVRAFLGGDIEMVNGTIISTRFVNILLEGQLRELKRVGNADEAIDLLSTLRATNGKVHSFAEGVKSQPDFVVPADASAWLAVYADFQTKFPPILTKTCADGAKAPEITTTDDGQGGQPMSNEQFRAHLLQQTYLAATAERERGQNKLIQLMEKMGALSSRIAGLNMDKIRFNETIALLREGIELVSQIKTQWKYITEFCQQLANTAEITLVQGQLDPFLHDAKLHFLVEKPKYRKRIIEHSQTLFVGAQDMHMMAKSYVDVSRQYVLLPLAGIAGLIASTDLQSAKDEMAKDYKIVKAAVQHLIMERRLEHDQIIKDNLKKYTEILKALPPASG